MPIEANSTENPESQIQSFDIEEFLKSFEHKLEEMFPAKVIPRNKIDIATGYILHPGTCSNEDSLGTGIEGRFKIGRHTVYPIPGIISKIRSKIRA